MISLFRRESPEVKAKKEELNSWKKSLYELVQMVDKAKQDLKTGVDRNWVEFSLKNNHITKEGANEVLNSILALESIISFGIPNIESLKEKIKDLEIEIKQLEKR